MSFLDATQTTAQPSLTKPGKAWVERTLASLNIDEAIAHLICPEDRKYKHSDWEYLLKKVPLVCLFGPEIPVDLIQSRSRHPLLIAGDLEHGAGAHLKGCTEFPWGFAIGA